MPKPTIAQLQAFVAVADHGTYREAAHELHTSQPAVTQQVQALERTLSTTIFDRTSRGTKLTPEGYQLLPYARAVLESVETLRFEAERVRTGFTRLRLSAIPTMAPYLLPGIVRTMRADFPSVQLSIGEARTASLIEKLVSNDLDMGLLATPVGHPALTEFVVADDPFLLAVASDHPMAESTSVGVHTLKEAEVLLIEDGHCLRDQTVDVCSLAGVNNTRDVGSAGLSTVCQMVVGGQGVALLPRSAATLECRTGTGLHGIPFAPFADGTIPKRTIALAWRTSSPHADELLDFAHAMKSAITTSLG